MAADLSALRPAFEAAGARLTVVSAIETGADEFREAVWTDGELYFDDQEAFKKALGGATYRTWWLLKPWVMQAALAYAKRFGAGTDDVTHKKTQMLGGTFVVKAGEVVYTHHETSTFDNGSAKAVLAAVLGKSVDELPDTLPETPPTSEALAETCSAPKPGKPAEAVDVSEACK